jgi:hypothetical protein
MRALASRDWLAAWHISFSRFKDRLDVRLRVSDAPLRTMLARGSAPVGAVGITREWVATVTGTGGGGPRLVDVSCCFAHGVGRCCRSGEDETAGDVITDSAVTDVFI